MLEPVGGLRTPSEARKYFRDFADRVTSRGSGWAKVTRPDRPDPTRPDPTRPDPTRSDPIRPDPIRPDPTRPVRFEKSLTRPDATREIWNTS